MKIIRTPIPIPIPIPIYLPHDVIESILIRLPVKSLLRFQAVCKRWSATISDPIFGNSHLQQSKNSLCSGYSFFVPRDKVLRRAVLENDQLLKLPPLQYPQELKPSRFRYRIWCYCDGLFLVSYRTSYVVWNPSRRTQRELVYPYEYDPPEKNSWIKWARVGIYYHSVAKDYRVVVVSGKHNAVFSCKNNSWSEKRSNTSAISFHDVPIISSSTDCAGVTYRESIYWATYGDEELGMESQIVCFDGEDESLKIVCNIDPFPGVITQRLLTSRDDLYLFTLRLSTGMKITKILPEWREHEAQLPQGYVKPLIFIPQDKVIFISFDDTPCPCLLYDHSGTGTGTGGETTPIHPTFDLHSCYNFFSCIETLFLL